MVVRAKDRDGTTRLTGTIATFDTVYPVGSLYFTTNDVNPSDLFGGLWERYATGRVVVGYRSDDSDFDAPGKMGGSKIHAHGIDNSTTGARIRIAADNAIMALTKALTSRLMTTRVDAASSGGAAGNSSAGIALEGTSDNASSMPPYITTYIWRRTL